MYGHAGLALWGTDSIALVIDLDEYVMTSSAQISLAKVRWQSSSDGIVNCEEKKLCGIMHPWSYIKGRTFIVHAGIAADALFVLCYVIC
jgi:hypothetical protein